MPELPQTTLRKVLRWDVRSSLYTYTCMHIKGEDNVWADLLGRWSAPGAVRRLVRIYERPSSSAKSLDCPTRGEMASLQQGHTAQRPTGPIENEGLLLYGTSAVWIPDDASDMQLCHRPHGSLWPSWTPIYQDGNLEVILLVDSFNGRPCLRPCVHSLSVYREGGGGGGRTCLVRLLRLSKVQSQTTSYSLTILSWDPVWTAPSTC